jgi:hypothetical protein
MDDPFDAYSPEGVEAQWRQQCDKVREMAVQCGRTRPDLSSMFETEADKFCNRTPPSTVLELDDRIGESMDLTYQWQLRLAVPPKPKKP